jgi:hypothetical protein
MSGGLNCRKPTRRGGMTASGQSIPDETVKLLAGEKFRQPGQPAYSAAC